MNRGWAGGGDRLWERRRKGLLVVLSGKVAQWWRGGKEYRQPTTTADPEDPASESVNPTEAAGEAEGRALNAEAVIPPGGDPRAAAEGMRNMTRKVTPPQSAQSLGADARAQREERKRMRMSAELMNGADDTEYDTDEYIDRRVNEIFDSPAPLPEDNQDIVNIDELLDIMDLNSPPPSSQHLEPKAN